MGRRHLYDRHLAFVCTNFYGFHLGFTWVSSHQVHRPGSPRQEEQLVRMWHGDGHSAATWTASRKRPRRLQVASSTSHSQRPSLTQWWHEMWLEQLVHCSGERTKKAVVLLAPESTGSKKQWGSWATDESLPGGNTRAKQLWLGSHQPHSESDKHCRQLVYRLHDPLL